MAHFYGIPDEEFIRGDVPMTKREIRMAVLNEAHIQEDSIVLDVGAGTGSLSIEAALGAPKGHVYAIERFDKGIDLIEQNKAKFNTPNLTAIKAKAPEGMDTLPALDAVIIGGSAGGMEVILDEVERLLKVGGRLVVTAVTMETGYTILKALKQRPFTYEGYQMAVSRFKKAGPYHMMDPLSPIFIVTATKVAQDEEASV
ncbi:MAG: precorrin-6Y C5,15-methyltransferase (decarboxylating) subunit CbiT [Veillonella sp.]|uniref:precorrin-6Y C5,15-methyltransferase (decarboxylating) subunit CbiT n=1 Tax=Veillonella sp. TaxID=1926307 RepID=UPI0025FC4F00|nr:precorrin-6Y C5,15-methyltransferase (decarboxylating) subunit CbiT [Veillonella sp.]MBS4913673.1 precorrin-6Y C5,15-methyltransferase (decarboxylating) subunit CbiT [Veillonella sp.]